MKVVINRCYGGFSISQSAAEFMASEGSAQAKAELEDGEFYGYGYSKDFNEGYRRDDPLLVLAVETLGEDASGACSKLTVVDIPDGVQWEIEEYDGREWIAEKHRTWG